MAQRNTRLPYKKWGDNRSRHAPKYWRGAVKTEADHVRIMECEMDPLGNCEREWRKFHARYPHVSKRTWVWLGYPTVHDYANMPV